MHVGINILKCFFFVQRYEKVPDVGIKVAFIRLAGTNLANL